MNKRLKEKENKVRPKLLIDRELEVQRWLLKKGNIRPKKHLVNLLVNTKNIIEHIIS